MAGAAAKVRDVLGWTPLHDGATGQYHSQVIAAALIDHWADVNARNGRGFAPLHGAVGLERPEAVRLLLAPWG